MNKEILRLAVPNIIANITVPLLGLCDTAIAGHLSSELALGAVSAAGVVFNFLYWNFSFLRMGTAGFTAQAVGAKDEKESAQILLRSLFTAICAGFLPIILQTFIFKAAFLFIKASPQTQALAAQYFYVYIWSAPFVLMMFAFNGWFIGMQNAKTPMAVAISSNLINVLLSLLFVFRFDMDIKGLALGSLAAQIFACGLSVLLCLKYYGGLKKHISAEFLKAAGGFALFFKVNRDIFLRSFLLILVTFSFTSASARSGDVYLAANSLLMQFFLFFSYLMDGFAYAAEALSGKYLGARDYKKLFLLLRRIFAWGLAVGFIFSLIYLFFAPSILALLTNKPSVITFALKYRYWAAAIPLAGFAAFLWDGVFVGITASKQMRDSMFCAAAAFFGIYFMFADALGNNALWLAFLVYLSLRGAVQFFLFGRIKKNLK